MVVKDARSHLALRCEKEVIYNTAEHLAAAYACKGDGCVCPVQHCKKQPFSSQNTLCSHLLADHFQSVKALAAVIKHAAYTGGQSQACPFAPATSSTCTSAEGEDWTLHMQQQHLNLCWIAAQKLQRSFVYDDLPCTTQCSATPPTSKSWPTAQNRFSRTKYYQSPDASAKVSRADGLIQSNTRVLGQQVGCKVAAKPRNIQYPCPLGCPCPTMPAWQVPDHVLDKHFDWLVQWVAESSASSDSQHLHPTCQHSSKRDAIKHGLCSDIHTHENNPSQSEVDLEKAASVDNVHETSTQQHAHDEQKSNNDTDPDPQPNVGVDRQPDQRPFTATNQHENQDMHAVADPTVVVKGAEAAVSSRYSAASISKKLSGIDGVELDTTSQTHLPERLEVLVQTFDLEELLKTDQGFHEQDLPLLFCKYHKPHFKPGPPKKMASGIAQSARSVTVEVTHMARQPTVASGDNQGMQIQVPIDTGQPQLAELSPSNDALGMSWEEQVRASLSSPSRPAVTGSPAAKHSTFATFQTLQIPENMPPTSIEYANTATVQDNVKMGASEHSMITASAGSPSSMYQQPVCSSPSRLLTASNIDNQLGLQNVDSASLGLGVTQGSISPTLVRLSKEELFARAEAMISGSSWDE